MIRITALRWLFVFATVAIIGCSNQQAGTSSGSSSFADAPSFALYEGLPRESIEPTIYAAELKKPTRAIGPFKFYSAPLSLSPTDGAALKAMLTNGSVLTEWGGAKACGSFHPDFCLAWTGGKKATYMCLCFSCSEVLVFNANQSQETFYDMKHSGKQELAALLARYRTNRPASEGWRSVFQREAD